MATKKPRFPITVEPEIADIIENYRHKHKINSTSKATVELLIKGIQEDYKFWETEEEQRNKPPTAEDAAEALYELLYYYLGAPPSAEQVKAVEPVITLLCNGLSEIN